LIHAKISNILACDKLFSLQSCSVVWELERIGGN
jgi:hypothetical protein